MNNFEEGTRTPSKGPKPVPTSSPSTRSGGKKATKNAKITNFFTKVSSPLNRNNSNSNNDQSENDNHQSDDLSKDASSSSMKMPESIPNEAARKIGTSNKEYVFIIPSSDDDTNVSNKSTSTRRGKAPSVHSSNSKSSDGLILSYTNNELSITPRRRANQTIHNIDKSGSNSNHEMPSTPTRSSGRNSRSRDSIPDKKARLDSPAVQALNQNSGHKINRITPTLIGTRTKMIDFQSVPSDLNLPREQAMKLIEKLFLVKMPEDFFLFWEFAKTINHRKPCSAFSQAYLEWKLVGPYDVLSGLITDFHGFSKENLLRHCRYYYDPPEFQTVITKKDSDMTHYGYYRDDVDQDKPIVIMNKAAQGGQLHEVGDNLFTLLKSELEASISTLSQSSQEIPQLTSSSSTRTSRGKLSQTSNKQSQLERAKAKQELTIIRDKLIDFCSSHENLSCESWSRTNARRSRRCAKTLNTVGIVVSNSDNNEQRNLGLPDSRLKTMLTKISDFKDDKTKCGLYKELHQMINNVNTANDSSEFGMGLELGLDLFFQGDTFYHKDIESLLSTSYRRLGRPQFFEIIKAHLEDRKKNDKVSLLD